MASSPAVCAAGFIHIFLGMTIYQTQAPDVCSPAPPLASYIFAAAILLVAADTPLFLGRYLHLPYFIQFLVETMGTLGILEIFDLWVWFRLERLIYQLVRLLFLSLGMEYTTYLEMEYWLLGVPTTALAAIILFIVNKATQFHIKILGLRKQTKVHLNRELYMEMIKKDKQ